MLSIRTLPLPTSAYEIQLGKFGVTFEIKIESVHNASKVFEARYFHF